MISTSTEPQRDVAVPFHDSHWKTRWLIVGLAVLFLWRSTAFLDRDWLAQLPWWIWLVAFGLIPQAFLLLFPVVTRIPSGRFEIPTIRRCLIEFCVAIPVVIRAITALVALEYLLNRFSPGDSLMPDVTQSMVDSSRPIIVYLLLVFSFTFAPVAEEVFFRGFLYNAFRMRMPWILAIISQSLIFGFVHFFGTVHSVGAFLGGILLTLIYAWRKTLVTPILVHAGVNAASALGVVLMMIAYANSPILGVAGQPNDTACVIRQIVPDSAAEKAGLQVGDVVVTFNGTEIRDVPRLAATVRLYQPGDTIPVSINRAGTLMDVKVVLQRRGDARSEITE